MRPFDVIVLGAGAAGMMCAAVAGQRGLRVAVLDHARRLGEKIRISGGGRCNFTNRETAPDRFLSDNPAFCRSALSRYTARDFIQLVNHHRIPWHEKHRGQLFCDDSSERIIRMLQAECDKGGVGWYVGCPVHAVRPCTLNSSGSGKIAPGPSEGYEVDTGAGRLRGRNLVVATGGMAIPQLGASDFGLQLARQFGLKIIEPRPALVPLVFDGDQWQAFASLAGLALEVHIETGKGTQRGGFVEDLLFTHRGLSGPAVLQVSSYWQPGTPITINLAPAHRIESHFLEAKQASPQQHLHTVLAGLVPRRLAAVWLDGQGLDSHRRIGETSNRLLQELGRRLSAWSVVPKGTAGFRKAEVMKGGVDTKELNQQSLEARRQRGLYFIGEVVDVTGWLGGYNFQWAWSSAVACGRALEAVPA